ncbi:MAG: hypothetical protein ACI835_005373, partial [Planctomycetota bacterium]
GRSEYGLGKLLVDLPMLRTELRDIAIQPGELVEGESGEQVRKQELLIELELAVGTTKTGIEYELRP